MPAVVLPHADLPFPGSLPEFQRLFPDDTACAAYLEAIRWRDGFVCGWCGEASEPYRFANRPQVLRCRKCQRDNALTAGTVMERTRTPLSIWFWAAYLVSSHTPGISAVQFQRQLGLNRYETAFQILHKLRAGMVRPGRDRIGGQPRDHVEIDESWVGGRTRGEGRGVHDQSLVIAAVEVRQRKPENVKGVPRRNGRYAGRIRMEVVPDRSARSLCGFVEAAVEPGAVVVTDLQAYLNEFTFRFNRRFYPFNAFRSLLGISGQAVAPTYDGLYTGSWQHPKCNGESLASIQ